MTGNLKKIADGESAALVKSLVLPYLEGQRLKVLSLLEAHYRQGDMPLELVWGKVGEIVALKDLATRMEKDIKMGWIEAEKEFKSGS